MNKKLIGVTLLIVLSLVCMCGCAKKCASCGDEIAEGEEISIGDEYYDAKCVEYCAGCEKPFVKDKNELLTYEGKRYCQECFDKEAYPIVLEDNDKVNISIVGYDNKEGMFSVKVKNKTKYQVSVYQEGESVLLDGKDKCIAETDGTHSFAYIDVPANEELTVFSSFRENNDEGWENIYKMSDLHSFEFAMTAWIDDEKYDDFWDTKFKVTLTPEMFGYVK